MSGPGMIALLARTSPRLEARITGFLYLLIFVVAPSGAKTATMGNMTITLACDIGVAVLLYYLLRPVNQRVALFAMLARLVFVVVLATTSLQYFGFVSLIRASDSAATFNRGYGMSLVPFGIHCLLVGYLIFKANFLPRILGILMAVAGLGYLTFLRPSLGESLFIPYIVVPAVVAEGSLTLWLLVMGVNSDRWRW